MDASSLVARVREVLQQSAGQNRAPESVAPEERRSQRDAEHAAWMADVLGGWWHRAEDGVCLVIDRDYRPDVVHGQADLGAHAEALQQYGDTLTRLQPDECGQAALEFGASPPPGDAEAERLLFFDLETTGLSGGAGTCAFLIGCGWFEGYHFRTRQFFLTGFAYETALLRRAADAVGEGMRLVTFNGKAFDVPLIEGRYLFHRLASPFGELPHLDLLHHARRLWRYRPAGRRPVSDERFESYFRASERREAFRNQARVALTPAAAGCALTDLEGAVLGFRRTGDVPGLEIPSRFFHYLRTGDVRPLEAVMAHNRYDVISLAALTAVVARMVAEGAPATANAHECLALGRVYERSGKRDRAAACFRRAGALEQPPEGWAADLLVQKEALRQLARTCRRQRRHEEAAEAWERMLASSAEAALDVEALESLAVHHEHRSKDLVAARAFALRALAAVREPRLEQAARHRLARIERKLGRNGGR